MQKRAAIRTRLRHVHGGQFLVEVVIAIGLLAIFASTLFVFIGTQFLSSTGTRKTGQAVLLAREGLEATRAIRDSGWTNVATGTHGISYANNAWTFQGTSDATDGFTRTVTVTDLSATERRIVSTVTWVDSTNRTQTITLATNISNWRNVGPPPRLSGDWKNPKTLGTIDLGPGNQATGLAVRNGIVYMSSTASDEHKPDFFVINAQDGAHPSIAASLNTGAGLNDVAINGAYAYAANSDSEDQLQIFSIATTSSPSLLHSYRLSGNNSPALCVAVTGTLAIVGTSVGSGSELYLVDVTNPVAPLTKATLEVGGSVNRAFILGNNAYLATSSSTNEFIVLDISNPNVPVVKAKINLPGSTPAIGLYVNDQDHRAYVTRQQGSGTSPEINIYDVTNPDAATFLGSMEFSSDIPAVFAADNLMFLGTAVSNLEFQIFDGTDPANLIYYSGLNFPQVATDIAFENNIVYVAVRSNDALRIITSQ